MHAYTRGSLAILRCHRYYEDALHSMVVRALTLPTGFVLLGVPVYYVTQKNEDMPRVFSAYGNLMGLVSAHDEIFSPHSKFLRQVLKQAERWFWMAGRRD
jgi:hypothetical protein